MVSLPPFVIATWPTRGLATCVSALGCESVSLCGDVSARLVVSCVYERSALCGSTLPCTSFASARFRDCTLPLNADERFFVERAGRTVAKHQPRDVLLRVNTQVPRIFLPPAL